MACAKEWRAPLKAGAIRACVERLVKEGAITSPMEILREELWLQCTAALAESPMNGGSARELKVWGLIRMLLRSAREAPAKERESGGGEVPVILPVESQEPPPVYPWQDLAQDREGWGVDGTEPKDCVPGAVLRKTLSEEDRTLLPWAPAEEGAVDGESQALQRGRKGNGPSEQRDQSSTLKGGRKVRVRLPVEEESGEDSSDEEGGGLREVTRRLRGCAIGETQPKGKPKGGEEVTTSPVDTLLRALEEIRREVMATTEASRAVYEELGKLVKVEPPWTKIKQTHAESFTEFCDRLQRAIAESDLPPEAQGPVMMECLWQQSDAMTQDILKTIPKGTPLSVVIRTVLQKQNQGTAAAQALVTAVDQMRKGPQRCFSCGYHREEGRRQTGCCCMAALMFIAGFMIPGTAESYWRR
ncbi:uncharacterized protein [Apteryx mantelli]|uniref:Gag polyprotein n=1 Tax=Apteryx mantelli TaxID=2696672 RepID=A0ABM4EKL0_9AVES